MSPTTQVITTNTNIILKSAIVCGSKSCFRHFHLRTAAVVGTYGLPGGFWALPGNLPAAPTEFSESICSKQ